MKKSKPNKYLVIFFVVPALIVIVSGAEFEVKAQGTDVWSPPYIIPGFTKYVLSPYLVADQNRAVHAFVSDFVGEDESEKVIYYSRWTRDQGWTLPTDILLSPHHQARVKGVYLDQKEMMHVVFVGVEDNNAEIYYSRAPAARANRAQSWSKPVIVGEKAITPDEAAITGYDRGNIHVVFGAALDGNSLYSVHSSDGGETWSDPKPIYLTYSDTLWPSHLNIYTDSLNNVHAVWSVGDLTGNGLAVYYAKLAAGTFNWTEPIVLAEAVGFEADTPSIIEHNNELFVVYHNDAPTTRWMRRSGDGGQSWSEPIRLFPHIGTNGAASMVVDSGGILHMFFGNRVTGTPIIYGMWHSTWLGTSWSKPVPIISGLKTDEFDPSFANAVVSQGNTILVTWHEDPQAKNSKGAKFSYLNLDTPEYPTSPLSTVSFRSAVIPTESVVQPTIEPTATPNNIGIQNHGDIQFFMSSDPLTLILFGIVPAIGLLFLFFLLRLGRRNRK